MNPWHASRQSPEACPPRATAATSKRRTKFKPTPSQQAIACDARPLTDDTKRMIVLHLGSGPKTISELVAMCERTLTPGPARTPGKVRAALRKLIGHRLVRRDDREKGAVLFSLDPRVRSRVKDGRAEIDVEEVDDGRLTLRWPVA